MSDARLITRPPAREVAELAPAFPPTGACKAGESHPKPGTEETDSGYDSATTTPEKTTPEISQDLSNGTALPSHTFTNRKTTKLRVFEILVPQHVHNRFHDLAELFNNALTQFLIKTVRRMPISFGLKVLGETEASAKPWIVVQCEKAISKRVEKFFNQRHIKAEYQPCDADTLWPSFKIHVCHWPPKLIVAIKKTYDSPVSRMFAPQINTDVRSHLQQRTSAFSPLQPLRLCHPSLYPNETSPMGRKIPVSFCDDRHREGGGEGKSGTGCSSGERSTQLTTLCGKLIKVGSQGDTRVATLGGLVKVQTPDGSFKVYGMTAGHVIARGRIEENGFQSGEYSVEGNDSDEDNDDSGEDDNEGELFELELPAEKDQEPQVEENLRDSSKVEGQAAQVGSPWSGLGHVNVASLGKQSDKRYMDWALLEIDNTSLLRPNLLVVAGTDPQYPITNVRGIYTSSPSFSSLGQRVTLVGGVSGRKHGNISTMSSYIMTANANEFTRTYSLALSNGSGKSSNSILLTELIFRGCHSLVCRRLWLVGC